MSKTLTERLDDVIDEVEVLRDAAQGRAEQQLEYARRKLVRALRAIHGNS